ncbi:MAG TPA: hypothetical protein VF103_00055 [Polyangiaceae bacterium]
MAVACAGAAAAVVALAHGVGRFGPNPAEITLTAESLPPPAPVAPTVAPQERETPAARLEETPRTNALPVRAPDEPRDEASCKKLASAGSSERAVECYRTLARGSGIGAEVASYEAARISAESLHDGARTLRLLDEHAQRFPGGNLRVEARWLRVQSLERVGRLDEALSESEALLAAPEGRSLSSEIHWLRARIYDDARHDCQRAVSELVALVGWADSRGDDAEMRRAACLERLGRSSDALAAYEHYLERAEPRRASEARAKVEALRP